MHDKVPNQFKNLSHW